MLSLPQKIPSWRALAELSTSIATTTAVFTACQLLVWRLSVPTLLHTYVDYCCANTFAPGCMPPTSACFSAVVWCAMLTCSLFTVPRGGGRRGFEPPSRTARADPNSTPPSTLERGPRNSFCGEGGVRQGRGRFRGARTVFARYRVEVSTGEGLWWVYIM